MECQRRESSMTRKESSPRSGTEATTEIEATCFLRGKVDFVDKHRTIHFEREKERERERPGFPFLACSPRHDRSRTCITRRHEAMIYGLEEGFSGSIGSVDAR